MTSAIGFCRSTIGYDSRMRRALLVIVCLLSSCRTAKPAMPDPPPPVKYDPALDPVAGPLWVQATQTYVAESCEDRDTPGDEPADPPSKHRVDVGSVKVEQPCGLVFNEVFAKDYIANFTRAICGSTDGKLTEECSKRFVDMFMARLSERYTGADWAAVNQKCTAYPLECNDGRSLERLLIASHNGGVQAWYFRSIEIARTNAYRAQEAARAADQLVVQQQQERDAERRRAVFQVMGAALQGLVQARAPAPTIQCTSNTVGTSTYTNCR